MKPVCIEGKTYTFTSHHFDGAPIDFNNPKDVESVTASIIKGMEGVGYTYVGQDDKPDDCTKAQ